MRKIIKKIFINILYFFYSLLVKITIKDKRTIPSKYVYDIFEIFPAAEKNVNNKISLPYVQIDNFNRHDLNRPYEVLPVDILNSNQPKEINIINTDKAILPLAILDREDTSDNECNIDISYGGNDHKIILRYKNRFHYLPLENDQKFNSISVQCEDAKLAIGEPVINSSTSSNPKLIVHIFVDAMSRTILDLCNEDAMPFTKSFFSSGKDFKNVFSQGDWTLSSISGAFTGRYTKDHLVYHPRRNDKISFPTLAETLDEEGYLTSLISSIPKITPLNGFDKGFKRCVIAPHEDANFIINEAIEQLDSFHQNQYLFLGFFDIHEAYRLQPISSQLKNNLSDANYKNPVTSNTLEIKFDEERLRRYKDALQHFDSKLELLYKAIESFDNDATVLLHSDHGVDFITLNSQRLSKERQKVPLMLKGKDLDGLNEDSIKEIREIPSIIMNLINKKHSFNYGDSGMSITESIYPKQDYELAIRDQKYTLFFQVPWRYVHKREKNEFNYNTTFCLVDDELASQERNIEYDSMLQIAINHYQSLIDNLIKFEDR